MGHLIPWQDRREWDQVVVSITTATAGLGEEAKKLHEIARRIDNRYAQLEELLDDLCVITCCSCTTICCTIATVCYDLKDLLFLYLTDHQLPQRQITRNANGACAHLTAHGCCLNRRDRPFICTWYICAAQKEVLSRQEDGSGKEIFAYIEQLKTARRELEDGFVGDTR